MPKAAEKIKPYYSRIECWLPANMCKEVRPPIEEVDGRCRFWPPHMDEVYRKAYPNLHRQIDNFRNKNL